MSTSPEPEVPVLPKPVPARAAWRDHHAFGLPAGSVRGLLALIVFSGIWAWLYLHPDNEVPSYLRDLMFIIMGHYFAVRGKPELEDGSPPPLFLPDGTIRIVLLLGFAVVVALLTRQHRLYLDFAGITLILVGGFMLGVIGARISGKMRLPRMVEDIRAAVSLSAGLMLLLLVFGVLTFPRSNLEQFLHRYRTEDILAALVGFYFGSRS